MPPRNDVDRMPDKRQSYTRRERQRATTAASNHPKAGQSRLLQTLVMRPSCAILLSMTRALECAFAEAAKLPPDEQDRIGQWLLAELADERAWDDQFSKSQDVLAKLADEALEEIARGDVSVLDPAKL